jgi:hypothetical protein
VTDEESLLALEICDLPPEAQLESQMARKVFVLPRMTPGQKPAD